MTDKRICTVYKSLKREEMYLYIDRQEGMERVPEALLAQFGEPQEVLTVVLEPGRKLARVDAAKVLEEIADKGFFLQMPPVPGANKELGANKAPADEG